MNPGFPLSLDVKGWPCLVLGGDEEAADKAIRLLDAGAKVTVINPTLNDTLKKLTASAKVIHRGRLFRATDTPGVVLVLNCLRDNREFSESLLDLARKDRFQVWSVDQPEHSTVMMPAVVSRGHLRIAVSTSGASPALASRIRQDLEAIFGSEAAEFLSWLAELRDETKAAKADYAQRKDTLRRAVQEFKLTGQVQYPSAWLRERTAKPETNPSQ
ncbi:MAG: bifunctional precorrin-2 dehydrogenase/sirohydrochlorin ferrochelatase [Nitrospiraceae bacterium]